MGIHGIYQEIGKGERVALSKLAVEKFEETGRPLRIAIDVSIWLFQIQAARGGTNPAPRTFYYRLLRLIAHSINPIFVFDGPNKPPFKRGKRSGPNVSSIPDYLAKQLIKQFGFPIHYAPGEAEAECALLQREGIVDAVLSEDVDTLMFGSGLTIRNWSPELKTGKTPTHVSVYDAVKTKRDAGMDREGMILVALMSGGDYVPEGIPGCGPKTACEAARAGFGADLCKIRKTDKAALKEWRERLQHELNTNETKLFKRRHTKLKIPEDFPRQDILGYYTHPVVSNQAELERLRRSMKWDQDIDFQGLRTFTHDAFDWIRLEGAKHFIRSLAPSMLVRGLVMRTMRDNFNSDDTEAIREDEALLVKGIYGTRQHAITDSCPEYRVSFKPIELVKIDLSQEEPDEALEQYSTQNQEISGSQAAELDLDDAEIEDGEIEDGPRKRGPTKFDPSKPARVWVMESFIKAGVPLTAEDYEAGLQRPKRTAKDASKPAPKGRATRRTKTTADQPQPSINQFAKVTKPGTRPTRASSKPPESSLQPKSTNRIVVDLLSSSPPRPLRSTVLQHQKEKSLSPVLEELPSSVTKRRRRAPMQRSHTLPVGLGSSAGRPATPPLATIETLDLTLTASSPAQPSPSQLPSKKAKTRSSRNPPIAYPTRQKSITASPTKQTTLDAWARSSQPGTPTKNRNATPPLGDVPLAAPPQFQLSTSAVDILDLTVSSPPRSPPATRSVQPARSPNAQQKGPSASAPRQPLQCISPNASFSRSSTSSRQSGASMSRKQSKASQTARRSSPRLQNRLSSAGIDTLDLTQLDSPVAHVSRASFTFTHTVSPSVARASPPPISQAKKKREIRLRQSAVGLWAFEDATDSPASNDKGKSTRRKWRESEIGVLDLVD